MAVRLLHRKKEDPPPPPPSRKWELHWPKVSWPRRRADADAPAAKTARRRRRAPWRRRPANPISVALWAASWAAVLILGLGMLLVYGEANQANSIVHAIMRTGTWLATPFHDVFRNPNPDHQLYENWGLAAGVYFVVGRALAWLLQWPR
jgi:hypothetical protein